MIAAIVQARTQSTRLPNKVLRDLCGKPLLSHVVERAGSSKRIERIILATTRNPKDDVLAEWAIKNSIDCYRGDEEDVLGRFYEAAKEFNADIIVRITADDPFKDPFIIDQVIALLEEKRLEFAYNNKPATFPEGLDAEVFTFAALERAFREARDPFEREHVTQYFYRHPEMFSQACLKNEKNLSHFRWTIDTEKDWEMAEAVYKKLYQPGKIFLTNDILKLLEREPEIASINSAVKRSAMYDKN